eukprot:scaffold657_cov561-Prasinococcus_capsulatus_cf.AAC.7
MAESKHQDRRTSRATVGWLMARLLVAGWLSSWGTGINNQPLRCARAPLRGDVNVSYMALRSTVSCLMVGVGPS